MRGLRKLVLALAAVALLTIGVSACGGGDSEDSSAGSTAATTAESTAPASAGSGKDEKQGGDASPAAEGSAAFLTPGGDNSIQNFGEEADRAEVEAASAVLAGYLRARAKDDWARECSYLARATIAPLEDLASRAPQLKGKDCAAILAVLAGGTPTSTRANTMTTGIASLRVDGDRGFAMYHGAEGVDYFVPMTREDGEWKVGALAPSEFL